MNGWHTKNGYSVSCIFPGRGNVFLLSGFDKNILIDSGPGYKGKYYSAWYSFITRVIVNRFAPLLTVKINYEPCQRDILVDQYLDLKAFGFNANVLRTPVHSPG